MGDTEQVQMDPTPVFGPIKTGGPTVRRRRVATSDGETDKQSSETPSKPSMPKYLRVLLLLSLIPIMFYLPKVLSLAGEKVQKNQHLLIYLWVVYGSVLVSVFFFFKRKTITLDSFATQIMAWLVSILLKCLISFFLFFIEIKYIFSLGIYHLVDLPKMVDMHLRKDVLYVWCSFTMIFNLAYFFIDNTDHQEAEKKEKLKEEKRQKKDDEKKKKQAEKRKKKLEKMMSPRTRFLVNALIYIGLVVLIGLIARWSYSYYLDLQTELYLAQNPVPPTDFAAEEKITEPVEGRDY